MMIQRTKLRLSIDETARHIYICDHHKNIIQTMRSINKRKKKDDDDDSIDEYSFNNNMNYDLDDLPVVDLSNLQVNTLRRYKRHYRVSTKPGINKSQLVEVFIFDTFRIIFRIIFRLIPFSFFRIKSALRIIFIIFQSSNVKYLPILSIWSKPTKISWIKKVLIKYKGESISF